MSCDEAMVERGPDDPYSNPLSFASVTDYPVDEYEPFDGGYPVLTARHAETGIWPYQENTPAFKPFSWRGTGRLRRAKKGVQLRPQPVLGSRGRSRSTDSFFHLANSSTECKSPYIKISMTKDEIAEANLGPPVTAIRIDPHTEVNRKGQRPSTTTTENHCASSPLPKTTQILPKLLRNSTSECGSVRFVTNSKGNVGNGSTGAALSNRSSKILLKTKTPYPKSPGTPLNEDRSSEQILLQHGFPSLIDELREKRDVLEEDTGYRMPVRIGSPNLSERSMEQQGAFGSLRKTIRGLFQTFSSKNIS